MEYYAAVKNDEFVFFVGTWMNLETNILSKLTQEQKIKHRMFSLIGGCWTMRTHGHREGSTTHWGLFGGNRGGTVQGGELGRESMGRNARYRWWGGRQQITLPCVPMQLFCMSSHVPPNLKCNKKDVKNKKNYFFCFPCKRKSHKWPLKISFDQSSLFFKDISVFTILSKNYKAKRKKLFRLHTDPIKISIYFFLFYFVFIS